LEEQLHVSLQSGHISSEEFMKAKEEKRNIFPDGKFLSAIVADKLSFSVPSKLRLPFANHSTIVVLKANRFVCNINRKKK
jgi:hypothetical protein